MIATLNDHNYTAADTTYGKYDSGFHAWLVECCDPDEYDGDTDYGGIARYGKRLDYWDSQGFHSLATCDSEAEAEAAYQAWSDEYNAPEIEHVSDPNKVKRIVRSGAIGAVGGSTRYSCERFSGVAVYIYSPNIVASYYRDDVEYEVSFGQVWVCMVGDDQLHLVERDDLTEISDDDYCGGCGQIGCEHG